MATEKTITAKASDRKMNLAEIEAFVAEVKAAGGYGSAIPEARVAFGGGIKSLTVKLRED